MEKIPAAKKDTFFIGKNKNFESQSSKQKFVKKSPTVDKQVSSSSGSFLIKPSERPQTSENKTLVKPKKLFDKKKWRLQKYSKKYKLEQWEERRKKNLLNEYYKQVGNEPKFDVQKIYEKYGDNEEDNDNENNLHNIDSSKSDSKNDVPSIASTSNPEVLSKTTVKAKVRNRIHAEYQRKQEKISKKEEIERKRAEKAVAIKAYKQKKLEKYKKLNKKTAKGQPIMKYRMEMLLEQIQKSVE